MSERIPQSPPVIHPVPSHIQRPFWSVMIPAYNCIGYLERTIQSILVQDKGVEKMQIEVVDDGSSDGNVEALVKQVGRGRVLYYRQIENVGSLRNFETCLNRANGHWIHLLHGDDKVKPGFYSELESLIFQYPHIGSALTSFSIIDENDRESRPQNDYLSDQPGVLPNWLFDIATAQRVQPPSVVVNRKVYEHLGGFYGVEYGEDWEMWIRIAAHYQVAFSPKCLAQYRSRSANISSRSIRTGQNFKDILKVIELTQRYLPENKKKQVKKSALRNFSVSYARSALRIYKGDRKNNAAFILAKQSITMDQNFRNIFWLMNLLLLLLKDKLTMKS